MQRSSSPATAASSPSRGVATAATDHHEVDDSDDESEVLKVERRRYYETEERLRSISSTGDGHSTVSFSVPRGQRSRPHNPVSSVLKTEPIAASAVTPGSAISFAYPNLSQFVNFADTHDDTMMNVRGAGPRGPMQDPEVFHLKERVRSLELQNSILRITSASGVLRPLRLRVAAHLERTIALDSRRCWFRRWVSSAHRRRQRNSNSMMSASRGFAELGDVSAVSYTSTSDAARIGASPAVVPLLASVGDGFTPTEVPERRPGMKSWSVGRDDPTAGGDQLTAGEPSVDELRELVAQQQRQIARLNLVVHDQREVMDALHVQVDALRSNQAPMPDAEPGLSPREVSAELDRFHASATTRIVAGEAAERGLVVQREERAFSNVVDDAKTDAGRILRRRRASDGAERPRVMSPDDAAPQTSGNMAAATAGDSAQLMPVDATPPAKLRPLSTDPKHYSPLTSQLRSLAGEERRARQAALLEFLDRYDAIVGAFELAMVDAESRSGTPSEVLTPSGVFIPSPPPPDMDSAE